MLGSRCLPHRQEPTSAVAAGAEVAAGVRIGPRRETVAPRDARRLEVERWESLAAHIELALHPVTHARKNEVDVRLHLDVERPALLVGASNRHLPPQGRRDPDGHVPEFRIALRVGDGHGGETRELQHCHLNRYGVRAPVRRQHGRLEPGHGRITRAVARRVHRLTAQRNCLREFAGAWTEEIEWDRVGGERDEGRPWICLEEVDPRWDVSGAGCRGDRDRYGRRGRVAVTVIRRVGEAVDADSPCRGRVGDFASGTGHCAFDGLGDPGHGERVVVGV